MDKITKKSRVLLAGGKSGSGKTLITCAILSCLKNRGINVHSYKIGPDYIDPMFHKKVLDITAGNIDAFFSDYDYIREQIAGDDGDCIVMEGVMGIYDGISGFMSTASSYDVGHGTDTPIVLVLDCHGMAGTLLSIINGILNDDADGRIQGIILNRISPQLYDSAKAKVLALLEDKGYNARLLGCLPFIKEIDIKSRHLGLKLPDEIDNLRYQINLVASQLEKYVDIDALLDIMDKAPELRCKSEKVLDDFNDTSGEKLKIAVAYDDAFCFYYKENFRMLKNANIEPVFFSPLNDERLPDNVHGLLIGGGYPELYLEKLSSNTSMKESISAAIKSGMPSLCECGGFMYLHETVYDENDTPHEMLGVIEGQCRKMDRLVRFGYITLTGCSEYSWVNEIKGHEFHYYDSTQNGKDMIAKKPYSDKQWSCMHISGNHIWGFPHLYYPSCPELVKALLVRMKEYAQTI